MTFGIPRFGMTIVEWHASLLSLEIGVMDFGTSLWLLVFHVPEWRHKLGLCSHTLRGAPSSWGYGVPSCGLCRIRPLDYLTLVCRLKLGLLSPMHLCDFWSPRLSCGAWGCCYRLQHFNEAPRVVVTYSNASVWCLDLGLCTPTFRRGCRSRGCVLSRLGVPIMGCYAPVCPPSPLGVPSQVGVRAPCIVVTT